MPAIMIREPRLGLLSVLRRIPLPSRYRGHGPLLHKSTDRSGCA